ncbi:pneumococcal serine-rich repeat protein-like [Penaeus chinensis]|uniref:pneumococcal serine-rich repeat protein-like n=1 Tax=Penaeus chinensis TaxID=139456 RepID=UPI001FB6AD43|nr:pneumococcal serine-rich repeat protein-like [Penaeus chinensis]XP_047482399.1 pneumococcal serine-rich repeat protein-like [Penaeus chinensis]
MKNSDWREDEQNLGDQLLQEFAEFQSSRSQRISESDGSVGSDRMDLSKLSDGASQVANLTDSGSSSKITSENPTNNLDNTNENVPCIGLNGSETLQQQIDKNVLESELVPQAVTGSPSNLNSHSMSASPCRSESDINGKKPEEGAISNCPDNIMAGEQSQPLDGNQPVQEGSESIQNNLDVMSIMPGNPNINSSSIPGISQGVPGSTENNPMPNNIEKPPLTVRSTTVPGLIQNPSVTSPNYEQQQVPNDYYTLTELTPVNPTQLTYDPYPVNQNYPYYYEQNTTTAVPPTYMQPQLSNQWGTTPVNSINNIPFSDVSSNTWQPPAQAVDAGFGNTSAEKPEVAPLPAQENGESQLNNCTAFTIPPEVKENLSQGQLVTLGSGPSTVTLFQFPVGTNFGAQKQQQKRKSSGPSNKKKAVRRASYQPIVPKMPPPDLFLMHPVYDNVGTTKPATSVDSTSTSTASSNIPPTSVTSSNSSGTATTTALPPVTITMENDITISMPQISAGSSAVGTVGKSRKKSTKSSPKKGRVVNVTKVKKRGLGKAGKKAKRLQQKVDDSVLNNNIVATAFSFAINSVTPGKEDSESGKLSEDASFAIDDSCGMTMPEISELIDPNVLPPEEPEAAVASDAAQPVSDNATEEGRPSQELQSDSALIVEGQKENTEPDTSVISSKSTGKSPTLVCSGGRSPQLKALLSLSKSISPSKSKLVRNRTVSVHESPSVAGLPKRGSQSTPSHKSSHVRVLDFGTPQKWKSPGRLPGRAMASLKFSPSLKKKKSPKNSVPSPLSRNSKFSKILSPKKMILRKILEETEKEQALENNKEMKAVEENLESEVTAARETQTGKIPDALPKSKKTRRGSTSSVSDSVPASEGHHNVETEDEESLILRIDDEDSCSSDAGTITTETTSIELFELPKEMESVKHSQHKKSSLSDSHAVPVTENAVGIQGDGSAVPSCVFSAYDSENSNLITPCKPDDMGFVFSGGLLPVTPMCLEAPTPLLNSVRNVISIQNGELNTPLLPAVPKTPAGKTPLIKDYPQGPYSNSSAGTSYYLPSERSATDSDGYSPSRLETVWEKTLAETCNMNQERNLLNLRSSPRKSPRKMSQKEMGEAIEQDLFRLFPGDVVGPESGTTCITDTATTSVPAAQDTKPSKAKDTSKGKEGKRRRIPSKKYQHLAESACSDDDFEMPRSATPSSELKRKNRSPSDAAVPKNKSKKFKMAAGSRGENKGNKAIPDTQKKGLASKTMENVHDKVDGKQIDSKKKQAGMGKSLRKESSASTSSSEKERNLTQRNSETKPSESDDTCNHQKTPKHNNFDSQKIIKDFTVSFNAEQTSSPRQMDSIGSGSSSEVAGSSSSKIESKRTLSAGDKGESSMNIQVEKANRQEENDCADDSGNKAKCNDKRSNDPAGGEKINKPVLKPKQNTSKTVKKVPSAEKEKAKVSKNSESKARVNHLFGSDVSFSDDSDESEAGTGSANKREQKSPLKTGALEEANIPKETSSEVRGRQRIGRGQGRPVKTALSPRRSERMATTSQRNSRQALNVKQASPRGRSRGSQISSSSSKESGSGNPASHVRTRSRSPASEKSLPEEANRQMTGVRRRGRGARSLATRGRLVRKDQDSARVSDELDMVESEADTTGKQKMPFSVWGAGLKSPIGTSKGKSPTSSKEELHNRWNTSIASHCTFSDINIIDTEDESPGKILRQKTPEHFVRFPKSETGKKFMSDSSGCARTLCYNSNNSSHKEGTPRIKNKDLGEVHNVTPSSRRHFRSASSSAESATEEITQETHQVAPSPKKAVSKSSYGGQSSSEARHGKSSSQNAASQVVLNEDPSPSTTEEVTPNKSSSEGNSPSTSATSEEKSSEKSGMSSLMQFKPLPATPEKELGQICQTIIRENNAMVALPSPKGLQEKERHVDKSGASRAKDSVKRILNLSSTKEAERSVNEKKMSKKADRESVSRKESEEIGMAKDKESNTTETMKETCSNRGGDSQELKKKVPDEKSQKRMSEEQGSQSPGGQRDNQVLHGGTDQDNSSNPTTLEKERTNSPGSVISPEHSSTQSLISEGEVTKENQPAQEKDVENHNAREVIEEEEDDWEDMISLQTSEFIDLFSLNLEPEKVSPKPSLKAANSRKGVISSKAKKPMSPKGSSRTAQQKKINSSPKSKEQNLNEKAPGSEGSSGSQSLRGESSGLGMARECGNKRLREETSPRDAIDPAKKKPPRRIQPIKIGEVNGIRKDSVSKRNADYRGTDHSFPSGLKSNLGTVNGETISSGLEEKEDRSEVFSEKGRGRDSIAHKRETLLVTGGGGQSERSASSLSSTSPGHLRISDSPMGFEGSPNAYLGKTSSPHRFAPIKLPQEAEEPLATLEPSSQGQRQLSAEPLNPSQMGNENSVDPRSKMKGMTHPSSAITKVPGDLPSETGDFKRE